MCICRSYGASIMKITKQWLEGIDVFCEKDIKWFMNQEERGGIKLVEKLIEKDIQLANRLLIMLMDHKQYLKYSYDVAEMALPVFEKHYPNDKRPRKALELTKKYLENPTIENKDEAYKSYKGALDNNYGSSQWFFMAKYGKTEHNKAIEIIEGCSKLAAEKYRDPKAFGANCGNIIRENIKLQIKKIK